MNGTSRTTLPFLMLLLLAAFMGGLLTWMALVGHPGYVTDVGARPSASTTPSQDGGVRGLQGSIVEAAHTIGPCVVNIDTTLGGGPGIDPDGLGNASKGQGSGVIVTTDGTILTNDHVVQGATSIQVTLPDGRTFKGTVKGSDRLSDIAIVKVDAHDLPVATLGDSDTTPIGAFVIAVGNPYGFQHTVTMGVLSGRGREIPEPGKEFRNLLQTDAAINPGNSGGPLVDIDGKVIGINTAIIPQAQGIGFAIPINSVREIMKQLLAQGHVTRTYIGVMMLALSPELLRHIRLPADVQGVMVRQVVPGSPAAAGGLQPGDIIVSVDGTPTHTPGEVQTQIRSHQPGDSITVGYLRNGQHRDVRLPLAEMPQTLH